MAVMRLARIERYRMPKRGYDDYGEPTRLIMPQLISRPIIHKMFDQSSTICGLTRHLHQFDETPMDVDELAASCERCGTRLCIKCFGDCHATS